MEDKNREDRLIRHMKGIKNLCDRAHYDSITMARKIARLADRDVKDLCPDHAEEILALMNRCDGVLQFQLDNLDCLVRFARENGEDMPEVQKFIYQTEDLRKGLADLRLNIMLWDRWFNDEPSEAEKLEELMSRPSTEEAEAEKRLAYETGGANLLERG